LESRSQNQELLDGDDQAAVIISRSGFSHWISATHFSGCHRLSVRSEKYISNLLPKLLVLLESINLVFSFCIITLLFALIFKFIPDTAIPFRDVWMGAAVTSILFTVGKVIIGFYLGHSAFASTYGAAASLVVFLIWIYYSAQILLFGAELTHVYALKYGSRGEANILRQSGVG
jgi:Predicted membrane protein